MQLSLAPLLLPATPLSVSSFQTLRLMPKRSRSCSSRNAQRMVDRRTDTDNFFRATETADEATCLTDGVLLQSSYSSSSNIATVLPWIGFGTYKLGKDSAYQSVFDALDCGYRSIDTAFIYGGETTERQVGQAIQAAIAQGIVPSRHHVFVTTKHWRKYHGYEATKKCLQLSLKRLQLDYVDLYLIHWPGPAFQTMHRKKEVLETKGPWYYVAEETQNADQMEKLRSETWRAMEDALQEGKVRSIGVSNFTVEQLEALKKTANLWPPAVNQVEFHPLYPQPELLDYCRKEGIVLQAYASLGGQDTGKKQWNKLELEAGIVEDEPETPKKGKKRPKKKKLKDTVVSLLTCRPVVALAQERNVTPAQILLRWALSQNCAVIPKASSLERKKENAAVLRFSLTQPEIAEITSQVQASMAQAVESGNLMSPEDKEVIETVGEAAMGRLCWRNDPFRHLDC